MNCSQPVTVNLAAIEWLKTKYPALSIKAGLCEMVAGRIYIKTLSTQGQKRPIPDHEIVTMYEENPRSDSEMIAFARAIEAAHGITPATVEKGQQVRQEHEPGPVNLWDGTPAKYGIAPADKSGFDTLPDDYELGDY